MAKTVKPLQMTGWNLSLLQLIGFRGPKMTIQCGECRGVFKYRLFAGIDNPVVPCPHCGTGNQLSIEWESGVEHSA